MYIYIYIKMFFALFSLSVHIIIPAFSYVNFFVSSSYCYAEYRYSIGYSTAFDPVSMWGPVVLYNKIYVIFVLFLTFLEQILFLKFFNLCEILHILMWLESSDNTMSILFSLQLLVSFLLCCRLHLILDSEN
jgi:hypothetical protein